MKNVRTIAKPVLKDLTNKGCGECQTSCQSACKTSCTVANQECESKESVVSTKLHGETL
jgi:predicted ribosomally synthesized six-cysteine peptide SCIFF